MAAIDANASMWNEESGEVCFSVLARDIASSRVRSDVSKVSEKFELIKMKMETAADLKVDLCGDDFADRKHRKIQMDSKEVQATVVFFRRMITSSAGGVIDTSMMVADFLIRRQGGPDHSVTLSRPFTWRNSSPACELS